MLALLVFGVRVPPGSAWLLVSHSLVGVSCLLVSLAGALHWCMGKGVWPVSPLPGECRLQPWSHP